MSDKPKLTDLKDLKELAEAAKTTVVAYDQFRLKANPKTILELIARVEGAEEREARLIFNGSVAYRQLSIRADKCYAREWDNQPREWSRSVWACFAPFMKIAEGHPECCDPDEGLVTEVENEADDLRTALEQAKAREAELIAFAQLVRDFPVKNKNMPHGVWLDGKKNTGPIADWFCGEFLPKLKQAAVTALEGGDDNG